MPLTENAGGMVAGKNNRELSAPDTRCMSSIQGDVDVVGIANLLQAISNETTGGYLSVSLNDEQKTIEFSDKGIRVVGGTKRVNPIGQILVRTGRLTQEQLDVVLIEQQKTRIPLGKLVSTMGILPWETIETTLREQVAEEIYDLFTWWGAQFEFGWDKPDLDGGKEGPLADIYLDSSMMSIMLEAA